MLGEEKTSDATDFAFNTSLDPRASKIIFKSYAAKSTCEN